VNRPLAHIRVCDLTGQWAGAGSTRYLAAMGAEVIRVEDPVRQGKWDIMRGARPFADERRGNELGGGFNNFNVGKHGVTINLRTEEGRELLRRLIALSDVVCENFSSGVMESLGFGYDALRAIRDDIVYVSNCGFGHDGPHSDFRTWGSIVQAVCGLSFTSGLPDREPAGWGYSYMDHHGGNFQAMAMQAALIRRARTGEGIWIDMACTEAGASMLGPVVLDYTVNGRGLRRTGRPHSSRSDSPLMVPHNIYPAAGEDDWVAIAVRDDDEWRRLAGVIGESWAADAALTELAERARREDELDRLLGDWTNRQDRDELVARAREAGVLAAPITRPEERIDDDPFLAEEWGLWPAVTHPEIGTVRVEGLPVHLSETDWEISMPCPTLGQHNDEVFGGLLGLNGEELARLRADGVI
jgi:crotonobetainyl-CoA:carnitine CoA-transferase CaiB-like acyl-CoA transferase